MPFRHCALVRVPPHREGHDEPRTQRTMAHGQSAVQDDPMTPYQAPLDDIRFALRELSGLESLMTLPGAESLADADLTDAILEQAAHFATEVLDPLDAVGDRVGAQWSDQGVVTPP